MLIFQRVLYENLQSIHLAIYHSVVPRHKNQSSDRIERRARPGDSIADESRGENEKIALYGSTSGPTAANNVSLEESRFWSHVTKSNLTCWNTYRFGADERAQKQIVTNEK